MAAWPQPADADTLRICVATDTHIGYMGKDNVRKNDALNTFEEVLQICRGSSADLILHGGDLFHENKPQRGCLYNAMELLRRYCLGPGDVGFQVVSGPEMFRRGLVNYEDPNMNVDMPMFMIHGNHDDPGGDSNLSVANLLEVASLVNYFGRAENLENIVVKPVLLQKGQTRVAIYGLGNIRDERLHRALQNRAVRFETPENVEQWFNIMILHQNRHKGNKGGVPNKACIHEQMLPAFLDLVIWGHEHDCEVTPRENLQGEFYVVQPGSSVATSLSQGETKLKHIALIDVKGGAFQCVPTPLWTTRPLMFGEVSLSDSGLLRTDTQAIWDHLTSKIDELILQGQEECRARKRELEKRGNGGAPAGGVSAPLKVPDLPLVRLRVEHTGFDTLSGQSFGQQFADRVANPEDILLFHKRAGAAGAVGNRLFGMGDVLEIDAGPEDNEDGVKIQDIIYKHIDGGQSLQILTEPDLNDAVQAFVHRADPCAIERYVRQAVESANQAVLKDSRAADENEIRVQIQDRTEGLRQRRLATAAAGGAPEAPAPAGSPPAESAAKVEQIEAEDLDAGAAAVSFAAEAARPAAADRGRSGRGRGRGRGRGAEKRELPDGLEAVAPPAKAARGRGMPATPAAAHTGRVDSLRLVVGSQGRHQRDAVPAEAPAADQAAATAAPAAAPATGFLQKRGGAAAESVWGNPDAADPGSAARDSQPRANRKWQLRGSDAG